MITQLLLRTATLSILTFCFLNLQGQLSTKIKKTRRGGGNPCEICTDPNNWSPDLVIQFKPHHFPFKVDKVSLLGFLSNSPISLGNQLTNRNNIACNNFDLYEIRILSNGANYPNSIIYANSGYLDYNGNLEIGISLKSTICTNNNPKPGLKICSSYNVILEKSNYNLFGQSIFSDFLYGTLFNLDRDVDCTFLNVSNPPKKQIKNSHPSNSIIPIKDNLTVDRLEIYPNPVFDLLNLQLRDEISHNPLVQVFDLSGREYSLKKNHPFFKEKHLMQIDLSDLPIGTYILRIATENQTFVVKIHKIK